MKLVLGWLYLRVLSCYVQNYNILLGLLLFALKVNCLQTLEHMSAYWAIKA